MDIKRRLAVATATLAVAFGAGHLVQSGFEENRAPRTAAASVVPRTITPLAASAEAEQVPPTPVDAPSEIVPLVPIATGEEPAAPLATPMPPAAEQAASAAATDCALSMDVAAGPQASIDVILRAPCKPDTRVVLRHGGLAVTARTSATGALFVSLPALDAGGEVSALLSDGTSIAGAAPVALAGVRRVLVQWLGEDAFQLHAFENGAAFGAPGHVHAAAPVGLGLLRQLGDSGVDLPMLAEVYTFPAGSPRVDIQIEATASPATCGREILGEAIDVDGGRMNRLDLTLEMPGCDALGDILVLNNPFAGTTLAAAE